MNLQVKVDGTDIDVAPQMAESLRGYAKTPTQHEDDIRSIGETLNSIGGLKCMQQFYAFAGLTHRQGLAVQIAWHGVGDWEY